MSAWWLVLLMPVAFIGTFWWRGKINRQHAAFQAKMDLAGDDDAARRKLQAHYEKLSQPPGKDGRD